MAAREHRTHHGDRLRLVIFNADQHLTGLKDMRQNAHTFHNLRCAILHQAVVGGNVGFALRRVDNQRVDLIPAALQFRGGRETGSAKPGDAKLMNPLDQGFIAVCAVIRPAFAGDPAIFPIGINNDAHLRQR